MCQRNIGKTNRDRSFDIKYNTKVEKILKGSLDLIQSPSLSVKIAGRCQQTFENKKIVDITQQCFASLPPET